MRLNRNFLFAIASSLLATPALAERFVVVNGQRLSEPQIEQLESVRCLPIPNGYWLDWPTGIWGYERNPQPQGRINDPCRNPQQFRRPSLSERRYCRVSSWPSRNAIRCSPTLSRKLIGNRW